MAKHTRMPKVPVLGKKRKPRTGIPFSQARFTKSIKKVSQLRNEFFSTASSQQNRLNEANTILGRELLALSQQLAAGVTPFVLEQSVKMLEDVSKLLSEPPREAA